MAAIPHGPGNPSTSEHRARLSHLLSVHCLHLSGAAGLDVELPSTCSTLYRAAGAGAAIADGFRGTAHAAVSSEC